MIIEINEGGMWYHGSHKIFDVLEIGSTITQWKELAEAFSHKPPMLCYDDSGIILHNGKEIGYLYLIDEPIVIDIDIFQHPRTTMDSNAEFLTKRLLKVKMVEKIDELSKNRIKYVDEKLMKLMTQKSL